MHGGLETGSASVSTPARIHPDTSIGSVRLTVSDLSRSTRFYEQAMGLRATEGDNGTVALTAGGGRVLVELHGDLSARALDPRAPGMFHMAILMPDRAALARALVRLGAAAWPLSGASDHLVSEALYLADPDGNGIEIYRDRPRDEWPQRDGSLAMATLPLDLRDVLGELNGTTEVEPLAPTGTTMGHVHLQVSDLTETEDFYAGVLGFDVMVRAYPGALFVSAGGYHHHIGLNTWHSAGAQPVQPGGIGMSSFEVLLPTPDELNTVVERIRGAGITAEADTGGYLVRDPSGNGIVLRSA